MKGKDVLEKIRMIKKVYKVNESEVSQQFFNEELESVKSGGKIVHVIKTGSILKIIFCIK